MSTRVFLARHGATELSAEDRFTGETDVPLSAVGRDQVHRLAARLAHEPVVAVYASPLGRTVETARILAGNHTALRSYPGTACGRSRTGIGRG